MAYLNHFDENLARELVQEKLETTTDGDYRARLENLKTCLNKNYEIERTKDLIELVASNLGYKVVGEDLDNIADIVMSLEENQDEYIAASINEYYCS